MFIPFERATLLFPSGTQNNPDSKHLHIILNSPKETNNHQVLIAGVSSIYEGATFDDTCILQNNDHPFINHDSFVYYKMIRVLPAQKLVDGVNGGIFVNKGMMDEDIFQRVKDGVTISKHTPGKFKSMIRSY